MEEAGEMGVDFLARGHGGSWGSRYGNGGGGGWGAGFRH